MEINHLEFCRLPSDNTELTSEEMPQIVARAVFSGAFVGFLLMESIKLITGVQSCRSQVPHGSEVTNFL